MSGSEIISKLWDLTISILKFFDEVWDFLNTRYTIGRVEILGLVVTEGFSFVPLGVTSVVIIAILGVGLLGLFSPNN